MSTPIEAYPLTWPEGWTRTPEFRRCSAPYRVGFGQARDELLHELRLLGARDVVVSTNLPTRRDGLPYADAPRQMKDPGVAVYWIRKKQPQVMACDAWSHVASNLRAVGLAVQALRTIERTGASQLLERAFTGFARLPAQASVSTWRGVLGVHDPVSREKVERAYKEAARRVHPDAGGSHEAMVAVNRAYQEALAELGEVVP